TRLQAKQPLPVLPADAYVVILPRASAGSVEDTHKYAMTAVLNSVLTGQWISRVPFGAAQVALAGVIGLACGALLNGLWLSVAMVGIGGAITFLGLFCFAWFGVEFPWFLGCLSFSITAF